MTQALAHRGPDGDGLWLDDEARVGLGHRRLSIIDLSEAGAQPMTSASGRYVIVFNGEIYGFVDLRRELEARGTRFRGHSDTEVMLAAIEAYGFEPAMQRFNGMFAFALYDTRDRLLYLRATGSGKKPLYIGVQGRSFVFASELKSLRLHPAFSHPDIDRGALTLYLRHNYVPAPYSILRKCRRSCRPGPSSWSQLRSRRQARPPSPNAPRHTGAPVRPSSGRSRTRFTDEEEALEFLDSTLRTAVRERLVSDVPIGAFLSGGIDSSLIAALVQDVSNVKLKTYTVRFEDSRFNEADHAREIAKTLGTDHMEITATAAMALDRISQLPQVYDEPFADSSQLPSLLVAELAREQVTVALSGDGGDELFGGYSRYAQMKTFDRLARRIPAAGIQLASAAPVQALDFCLGLVKAFLPSTYREEASGDRVKKLADLLQIGDFDDRYLAFLSQWRIPSNIVVEGYEPKTRMTDGLLPPGLSELDRMMYKDTVAYLPDDVLVKVDRASMAVGLEMRAPLLDYRVLEAAWRMPSQLRMVNGRGKLALRRLLARRLAPSLFERPKQGFSVPVNDWLRGPLKAWASDILSRERIECEGVLVHGPILQRWREHLSGCRNWGPQLWTVIMYNAWSDRWRSTVH